MLLEDKKDPLFGYDPDTGINFGAGVSFFQNGKFDEHFHI